MIEDIKARLQGYLKAQYPDRDGLAVAELVDLTSGWECEIYGFDLEWEAPGESRSCPLILRVYSAGLDGVARREFQGIRTLYGMGYPVPEVHLLEIGGSPWGRPFVIMERVDGPLMGEAYVRREPDGQRALMDTFCRLLADLHDVDWHPFADEAAIEAAESPYGFIDRELARRRQEAARWSLDGFVPVIDWLAERRDMLACAAPSVVHRDFHSQNIILRDGVTPVIIDWPNIAVTDSRIDLAWTLVLAGAHTHPSMRDMILGGYQQCRGPVAHIDCFEVLAALIRLLGVTGSFIHGADKMGMRADGTEQMKRHGAAFEWVHGLIVEHTGVSVPEVEQMLASWS